MSKRVLGLDVGDVRIGVAVSDALGWTAQAVSTIHRKGLEGDLQAIQDLAEQFEVESVVVGYPLNMDGSVGSQADKVRAFADRLATRLNRAIKMWDERLSTAEARKVLIGGGMRREKRKNVIDQMAAMLILQSYLDSQSEPSREARTED